MREHTDMDHKYPQMVRPPEATLVMRVRIGETVRTPDDVSRAIIDSLQQYGRGRDGTLTPFAQQPGVPANDILDAHGNAVGEWHIEGV
jgi:hypothetical protein